MINYKYVLFRTEPGIGFGGYSDSHYEVHRLLNTADVKTFEEKLGDYYASVETIIVSTDERGIINYCEDIGIELNIEYERKGYGCYEGNGTYGGDFVRANANFDEDNSYEVDDSPRDKDVAKFVKEYDEIEVFPKIDKEVIYD